MNAQAAIVVALKLRIESSYEFKEADMSNIILIAETGSDVPTEIAEQYGIQLVPMHVSFGTETLDDGAFPVERIYEHYSETGTIPKTSGCVPDDFTKAFNDIYAEWPEKQILHLAYSAATTCSYQSAVLAAAAYEQGFITSIDTKQVSVGQAAVVIELAKLLEANPELPLQDAVNFANKLSKRVHMCFLPDKLEYLRAGGRVSNVAYLGSRILSLHPRIEIVDGLLIANKKYRGNLTKVVPRLIREYTQEHNLNKECLYLIWSAGLSDEVRQMAETEAKECGFQKVIWFSTGCVITTHGGPGVFGMVGISDE